MPTYDVFTPGGDYRWHSIGQAEDADQAAKIAGGPVERRCVIVHSYQDRSPIGRQFAVEAAHERMVITGTSCMHDAVATLDGLVKDVRISGWFPVT